jgi:hypothetical protein
MSILNEASGSQACRTAQQAWRGIPNDRDLVETKAQAKHDLSAVLKWDGSVEVFDQRVAML